MLPAALDQELSRDPFVLIRIHLSDGHSYVVRNPSLCFINRGALYFARTDRPHSRLTDDIDVIDLRHITRVEQIVDEGQAA
jgi:hypothetical protein